MFTNRVLTAVVSAILLTMIAVLFYTLISDSSSFNREVTLKVAESSWRVLPPLEGEETETTRDETTESYALIKGGTFSTDHFSAEVESVNENSMQLKLESQEDLVIQNGKEGDREEFSFSEETVIKLKKGEKLIIDTDTDGAGTVWNIEIESID